MLIAGERPGARQRDAGEAQHIGAAEQLQCGEYGVADAAIEIALCLAATRRLTIAGEGDGGPPVGDVPVASRAARRVDVHQRPTYATRPIATRTTAVTAVAWRSNHSPLI